MDRVKVESRAITEMGYDPAEQLLEVVWHPTKGRSAIWHYPEVTQAEYDELLEPDVSIGRLIYKIRARVGDAAKCIGHLEDEEVADVPG